MTTAAGLQTVLTVPERFRGPDETANGGWVGGTLAGMLAGSRQDCPVEVTLHRPVPLDTELTLGQVANTTTLSDGDGLLVEAIPVAEELTPPPFVPFTVAARAEAGYAGLRHHPFPGCFVCGTREPGDGLRIFPGPVDGTDLVAAGWRVPVNVVGDDGRVPESILWAALDCPTGWVHFQPGKYALLGRMSARVLRPVYRGGTYSIVARSAGVAGRKLFSESAIYETDGSLVAVAKATWIAPR